MYRVVTRAKNLDRECEVEARGAETDGFQGDDLKSPEIALRPEKCLYSNKFSLITEKL